MSAQKCDCSEKLVAWLDGELFIDEAAYLEQHLAACVECRTKVDAYKEVNVAVQAYCEATATSGTRRAAPSVFFPTLAQRPPRQPCIFLAATTPPPA